MCVKDWEWCLLKIGAQWCQLLLWAAYSVTSPCQWLLQARTMLPLLHSSPWSANNSETTVLLSSLHIRLGADIWYRAPGSSGSKCQRSVLRLQGQGLYYTLSWNFLLYPLFRAIFYIQQVLNKSLGLSFSMPLVCVSIWARHLRL